MKKITVMLCATLVMSQGFAQKAKVTSAWNYLRDYYKSNDAASLDKAKEAIDLASANDDSKGMAKTWMYRGKVYQAMFEDKLKKAQGEGQPIDGYKSVESVDLDEAYKAYLKCKELDAKNIFTGEVKGKMGQCSQHFQNLGIGYYNAQKYAAASPVFKRASEINFSMGMKDTANLSNAAIAAEYGNNFEEAIKLYKELITHDYRKGEPYVSIAKIYVNQKDQANAEAIIKEGRAKYPDNYALLLEEINLLLSKGENEKAVEGLKSAIDKDPNNANLRMVIANKYDNMANPKNDKGYPIDEKPENHADLMQKAEDNYKKAIELKPDYFEALYNLGVLYYYKGVNIAKKADDIMEAAKYKAEMVKAEVEYKNAMPYLEKAYELKGDDGDVKKALKQIYLRTDQEDKAKALDQ